jgi:hypothetical protein
MVQMSEGRVTDDQWHTVYRRGEGFAEKERNVVAGEKSANVCSSVKMVGVSWGKGAA